MCDSARYLAAHMRHLLPSEPSFHVLRSKQFCVIDNQLTRNRAPLPIMVSMAEGAGLCRWELSDCYSASGHGSEISIQPMAAALISFTVSTQIWSCV